jgi:hypothetical protein
VTDDGFTPDEARLVTALLDTVIPPSDDGRLPGAGTLGLIDHVVRTLRAMPLLRPVVEYGLGALAERGFGPDLAPTERTARLAEFAAADQFFLPAFLFLAYSGYYQHPRVVAALGLEPRPPHPQGYPMAAVDDLSLLEAVRRRGRRYRDAAAPAEQGRGRPSVTRS